MKKINYLLLVFSAALFIFCKSSVQNSTTPEKIFNNPISVTNVNVTLGIPTDNDSADDYLIFRPQYVLSYNHNRNTANWVSWELNSDWYGNVKRYSGNFITDTSLPESFCRVKHSDYTNSGYDRGHMVRSEERTKTVEDNEATFLLTNILPQTPDLNRGVWLDLERCCERLCKKENKELFVIAGGIFHSQNKIKDMIAIPDSCFKIIVILDQGQSLQDVNKDTHTIAVIMPNEQGIRNDKWEKYKSTIRRIEHSTGYNYLNNVRQDVQDVIENR